MEEVVGDMDFGLIGLHLKGTVKSRVFTISRNWLTLGGSIPPGPTRPQMSEHQKHRVDTGHSDSSFHVSLPGEASQDVTVVLTGKHVIEH